MRSGRSPAGFSVRLAEARQASGAAGWCEGQCGPKGGYKDHDQIVHYQGGTLQFFSLSLFGLNKQLFELFCEFESELPFYICISSQRRLLKIINLKII